MDGFELNKIAGAILLAGVIAMLAGFVSRILIPEPHMEESLIVASGAGEGAEGAGGAEEAAPQPIGPLLASASIDEGMKVARKCTACHTFEQGGANKVGPNLWDVVSADKAHLDDYSYSGAMAEAEGAWTYEELDAFLHDPRAALPGTKMSFAGLKKIEDRANIIAYLRSLSDDPQPLPEPAAEAPAQQPAEGAGEAAPADRAAAEGGQQDTAAAEQAQPRQSEAPAGDAQATERVTEEGAGPEQSAQTAPESAERQPETSRAASAPSPQPQAAQQTVAAAADTSGGASEGGSLIALIKAASPEDGARVARKCTACHTFDKGAGNRVGPNLWDVVGGPMAHRDDFRYSKAMEEHGGEWTYEALSDYLEQPRNYIPGNKMTFAGLKKPEERAAIIAYMRTMADNPPPLD